MIARCYRGSYFCITYLQIATSFAGNIPIGALALPVNYTYNLALQVCTYRVPTN